MGLIQHKRQAVELDAGEVYERLPAVTDGLVATFPMDGSGTGVNHGTNLIETDGLWTIGMRDSTGIFSANGEAGINKGSIEFNPWSVGDTVWGVYSNDTSSDADGGWNVVNQPIDNTKTYRLSVWIKRKNVGNGRTYFGTQGSTVWNLGTTTVNTNPYFTSKLISERPEMEDNWTLWVGHVHPHTYSGGHSSDSGIYMLDGTRLQGMTDYKWTDTATLGGHRTYLYYSTSPGEDHFWYEPRMEILDESSSTIEEMLKGSGYLHHPLTDTNTSHGPDGVTISETTTNLSNINWNTYWNNSGTSIKSSTDLRGAIPHPEYTTWSIEVLTTGNVQLGVGELSSTTASSTYSVSVWYYKDHDSVGAQPYMRQASGSIGSLKWDENPSVGWADWPSKRWIRLVGTGISTGGNLYISSYLDNAGSFEAFNAPQIELKNYSTGFVGGTRSASSVLSFKMKEPLQTYSITGKFTPYTPFDNTYNLTVNQAALFRIQDDIGIGNMYYRYYLSGGGTSNYPFLDADGSFGTSHIHKTYSIDAYKELTFIITKTGTTFTTQLYQDGIWKSKHTDTLDANNHITHFHLGTTTMWNGKYKDISFYNKVLSADEQNLIVTSDHSLNGDDLITEFLDDNENPNLWPDPDLLSTTYGVQNGIAPTRLNTGTYMHQLNLTNAAYHYKGYDIPTESGVKYIFSGWFHVGTNTFNVRPLTIEGELSGEANSHPSWSSLPINRWTYCTAEAISDGNMRFLIYPNNSSATGTGIIRWRNISVKKARDAGSELDGVYTTNEFLETMDSYDR